MTLGAGIGEHEGYLLHRYDRTAEMWESLLPYLRDEGARRLGPPSWLRNIEAIGESRLLLVKPDSYEVEILDLASGEVVNEWSGAGAFWQSLVQREGEQELAPFVQDVLSNGDGTAWFLLSYLVNIDGRSAVLDTISDGQRGSFDSEPFTQSLLERVDLDSGEVIDRILTPHSATMLLGPGPEIGHYAGDIPYPRLEVRSFRDPE